MKLKVLGFTKKNKECSIKTLIIVNKKYSDNFDTSALDAKDFKIINDSKVGLEILEKERPSCIILSDLLTPVTYEQIAVRFSELLMFDCSEMHLFSGGKFNSEEINIIRTLGFAQIKDDSSLDDFLVLI